MRILVVCGAGASSTFVAQRLRTAAAAAGLDWDAGAGVESTVPSADTTSSSWARICVSASTPSAT